MKKGWKILVFLFVFLLAGCAKREQKPPAVVTKVNVIYNHAGFDIMRSYTDTEKIEEILEYLRLQKTVGRAEMDPERLFGDVFRIEVLLSDGQRRVYRQYANRYISKDNRPWRKIKPGYGSGLYKILWPE